MCPPVCVTESVFPWRSVAPCLVPPAKMAWQRIPSSHSQDQVVDYRHRWCELWQSGNRNTRIMGKKKKNGNLDFNHNTLDSIKASQLLTDGPSRYVHGEIVKCARVKYSFERLPKKQATYAQSLFFCSDLSVFEAKLWNKTVSRDMSFNQQFFLSHIAYYMNINTIETMAELHYYVSRLWCPFTLQNKRSECAYLKPRNAIFHH